MKAQVPNPQTLRFLHTNLPDTSCGNLNPDISTYWNEDFTKRTNFSRQQTHHEFKPGLSHDAFQHISDESPKERKKEKGSTDDSEDEEEVDQDQDDDEEEEEEVQEEPAVDQTGVDVEPNHDNSEDDGLLDAPPEEEFQEQFPEEEITASDNDAEIPQPSASSSVETDTESGIHTRGQIAAYAGIGLSMSFRKHFFSMLILGRYARFIRWDRRGAVVTRRFDYTKHPLHIFNFYSRYCQLTPLERGFDPTVEPCKGPLPEPVCKAFNDYHQSAWYGGGKFKRGDRSLRFETFFRMEVTDDEQETIEAFFIPPPKYGRTCLYPFYRATRRSLACPYQENVKPKMCFLKESWQEESRRTAREAVIYRMLKKEAVKHVASMRLGGDVCELETETQKWVTELSAKSNRLKRKMVCHRIILDTVSRDLSTFSWCKVLLSCIADAVEGTCFILFLSVGILNDLSNSRSTSIQGRDIAPRSQRWQHNDC